MTRLEFRSDSPPAAPLLGRGDGARILLVRHAEVDATWQGRRYGDMDVPLSSGGERRSEELGARISALAPATVATSPLARARTLATHVSPSARVDSRLTEVHRGVWQGRAVDELEREHPDDVAAYHADPWAFRAEGAESDCDLARRAWPALLAALDDADGGLAVLVSHYNVTRVLVALALGLPPARSFGLRIDTGRCVLLGDDAVGFTLRASNVVDPTEACRAEALA